MKNIKNNFFELIGNTPILCLNNFVDKHNIKSNLLAKLESYNPGGSAKDRVALNMIEEAEKSGLLKKGYVIIEPTSGNTGIGLAAVAVSKGYEVILTMPETMSAERRALLKAYGAKIVLTDGNKGMNGAIEEAQRLAQELPGSFIPSQFTNQANPEAHFKTTGPEIWRDTEGAVDILIASVGTGGTITGTGKYLKKMNSDIKVIAVEPKSSPVLSGGIPGPHKIQGIGAGFIPEVFDRSTVDEIITVTDEEAYWGSRELAATEGLLVGISSGAVIAAAYKLNEQKEYYGKNIVLILPDSGERYLSTGLF